MIEIRASYREVLAEPVFRVVFYARSLAIAADVLRIVALSMLIFESTGSAALAAATFGAGFVPQVLGGMLLGALPDLVRPRRLIVLGYAAECVGALALALFGLPVWTSLLIVAVIGGLAPVLHGGAGRLIADALTGDAYVLGRSLLTMTSALAQLAGLAGGGIAAAAIGPPAHAAAVRGLPSGGGGDHPPDAARSARRPASRAGRGPAELAGESATRH